MKSTSEMRPNGIPRWLRSGRGIACLALATLVAASCMTVRQGAKSGPSDKARGFKFDHALHKQNGLDDCTVCHDPSSTDPKALSTPAHEVCSTCHEVPASGTTPPTDPAELAKCNFCHIRPDFTVNVWKPNLSTELKWQHAPHLAANIECATCHTGQDEAHMRPQLTMKFCMDCHEKQTAKPALNECATCHTTINKDTVPKFRDGQRIAHDAPDVWKKIHGQESKIDKQFCATCHDGNSGKLSCNECHSKEAPADHTLTWRNKTHGLQAEWNRNRCATCHEEDACVKCHRNTTPDSHRAGWGAPADRHCVTCHFPAQKNECVVCHENIDHEQAKPSPHASGVFPPNCGTCHPGRIPYLAPHPLNSTAKCVTCHR